MLKSYTQNMASLTETSYYARKIIRWSIILSISLLIFRFGFGIVKDLYQKLNPPPPPAPTVTFGLLPKISFPSATESAQLTFILETPTGELPNLGEQAKVFLSPYQRPNLLALDRANEEAAKLGFQSSPKPVSEKAYRWIKEKDSTIPTLEMDIFTGSFKYHYDWQNDALIFDEKYLPDKEQAIKESKNFLKTMQRLETDLEEGRSQANYLRLSGRKKLPAPSLSEADLVQVELFRKDVDEMPVLTADPNKGIASFLLLGAMGTNKKIAEVEFNYFPISYDSSATYPIKSISQAWEELNNNQAFITSLDQKIENITIRRIYLGYYDSWQPQQYLQPVYIFQGDNNFLALLPAITDEWMK